jgi:hypothetical protein
LLSFPSGERIMMGGSMATQAREGLRIGKRCFMITEKERAEVTRAIDEYEFVSMVLKYKGPMMPCNLMLELTQQNDMNIEVITYYLRSLILFDRITEN